LRLEKVRHSCKRPIQEQGRGQIIETIREIQERHDSVKEIEKSLLELHQIFMDMAVLVEAQGEQLNNIEAQVNRSASYVERGIGEGSTFRPFLDFRQQHLASQPHDCDLKSRKGLNV
jgi:hypothetical protein